MIEIIEVILSKSISKFLVTIDWIKSGFICKKYITDGMLY